MINSSTKNNKNNEGISYQSLILIGVSLFLGMIVILILQNFIGKENIKLSTLDLINFTFSVALSGASIILAISAIYLSKISEKTLLERNEASIDLQQDLYTKISAVLTKIQSSTGITEKRIEDIVRSLTKDLYPDKKLTDPNRINELENRIRESLSRRPEETEHIEKKYEQFQSQVLKALSNIPEIEVIKKGEGYFGKSGVELFDGVFKLNGLTFTVSIFFSHTIFNLESFEKYIMDIAYELKDKVFNISFLIFDRELEENHLYNRILRQKINVLEKDLKDKITPLYGNSDNIVNEVVKKVNLNIKTLKPKKLRAETKRAK